MELAFKKRCLGNREALAGRLAEAFAEAFDGAPRPGRTESRQGDVGMEGTPFGLDSGGLVGRLARPFAERGEGGRRRVAPGGGQAGPQGPGFAARRKRANVGETKIEPSGAGAGVREGFVETREETGIGVAKEGEGEMHGLGTYPTRLGKALAQVSGTFHEGLAQGERDLEGEEETQFYEVPINLRRSISRASWLDCQRIRSRSPGRRTRR